MKTPVVNGSPYYRSAGTRSTSLVRVSQKIYCLNYNILPRTTRNSYKLEQEFCILELSFYHAIRTDIVNCSTFILVPSLFLLLTSVTMNGSWQFDKIWKVLLFSHFSHRSPVSDVRYSPSLLLSILADPDREQSENGQSILWPFSQAGLLG